MSDLAKITDELKQITISEVASSSTQPTHAVLSELSLKGVAKLLRDGKVNKIVVLSGAGISVSAGIPDFRTPGTGLYSQLESYNLPHPQAIFDIGFFRENPAPFCKLAKVLIQDDPKPTPTHYFLRLLHDKNMLYRIVTQNIDSLESKAGIPREKLFQIHGGMNFAKCITCKRVTDINSWRDTIMRDEVPRCQHDGCEGLQKPDIVFFGEGLNTPKLLRHDRDYIPRADMFLCMGTSLTVMPAGNLVRSTNETCPRILINREKVGEAPAGPEESDDASSDAYSDSEEEVDPAPVKDLDHLSDIEWMVRIRQHGHIGNRRYSPGFQFSSDANTRDVHLEGACDEVIFELVHHAGWTEEFLTLLREAEHSSAVEAFQNFISKL